jgi:hypothetical protein
MLIKYKTMEQERRKYAKKKLKSWLDWFDGDKKQAAENVAFALTLPSLVNNSQQYGDFNKYLGEVCKRWANIS